MKKMNLKLVIYIIFLLVSFIVFSDFSILTKDVINENLESNVFTTDDIDSLLKDGSILKMDYFRANDNGNYDNQLIAGQNDLSINISGDFVTYRYTQNDLYSFNFGPSASLSGSTNITQAGGYRNGNMGYVSVPNGTYYFFARYVNGVGAAAKGPVNITNSCSNNSVSNQTSTFTVERCYIKNSNNTVVAASTGTFGTCASGYTMGGKTILSDGCSNLSMNGLSKRYCKVIVQATCSKGGSSNPVDPPDPKPPVTRPVPKLESIYVSSGSISPAFKSGTYTYNVSVAGNVTSVNISGTLGSGSSFVPNEGPRTIDLNYGNNVARMKVTNSTGKVITYTININREDDRSPVNTLSNMTISKGNLTPTFYSGDTEYTVDVDSDVDKITIDAVLTDNKSSFVPGNGPGTYDLEPGPNKIYIKVVSQSGSTNIYTITVNRATTPSECTTNAEDYALLKEIKLSADIDGIEIDQLEDFDPKIFKYDGIKLDFDVKSLKVEAYAEDDADAENIEIEGAEDLEVNVPRLITIKIKSSHCSNITNEYTIEVTRQSEKVKSDDPELDNLEIVGYKIDFSKAITTYGIKLKKGDDKLEFKYEYASPKTTCEEIGNENLKNGSEIEIKCLAEDGENSVTYKINIEGVEKGANIFVIIIVVIGIIILLVYLLLRLLGYRVVLNMSVIGAFFRGIGEKFTNMFDK